MSRTTSSVSRIVTCRGWRPASRSSSTVAMRSPCANDGWRIVVSCGRDGCRDRRVVEADDRDVVRNSDALAREHRERAARHEVARDEDRVGPLDAARGCGASPAPPSAVKSPSSTAPSGARARPSRRGSPAAGRCRRACQRARDRRDALVPALDQIGRGVPAAPDVVDVDVVVALALAHRASAVDDRHGVAMRSMKVSLVWCDTTIAPSTAPLRT